MANPDDPTLLSRDERIQQLARILANGIIRLLDPARMSENPKNQAQKPANKP